MNPWKKRFFVCVFMVVSNRPSSSSMSPVMRKELCVSANVRSLAAARRYRCFSYSSARFPHYIDSDAASHVFRVVLLLMLRHACISISRRIQLLLFSCWFCIAVMSLTASRLLFENTSARNWNQVVSWDNWEPDRNFGVLCVQNLKPITFRVH